MKRCDICNKELISGKIICLDCSNKIQEFLKEETFVDIVKEWNILGYELTIKKDVMQITGEENSITVDLLEKEFWIEQWMDYKVFTLLYRTMKVLKDEDYKRKQ